MTDQSATSLPGSSTCLKNVIEALKLLESAVFIYKADYTNNTVTGYFEERQPNGSSQHTLSQQKLLRSKQNLMTNTQTVVIKPPLWDVGQPKTKDSPTIISRC